MLKPLSWFYTKMLMQCGFKFWIIFYISYTPQEFGNGTRKETFSIVIII